MEQHSILKVYLPLSLCMKLNSILPFNSSLALKLYTGLKKSKKKMCYSRFKELFLVILKLLSTNFRQRLFTSK